MKLIESKSKAELSKFVESYWHFDGSLDNRFVLLPDGTFNVLISTHVFRMANTVYSPGIFLVPLQTKPLELKTSGQFFGIRFKAFTYANIVNTQIIKRAPVHPLNSVIYRPKLCLENIFTLNRFAELEDLKAGLEDLVFELLNHDYQLNQHMRAQVNYVLDRKGNLKISELCHEFGISRQGLHKYFKSKLGVSPKELAMVWRLNHYFTLLGNSNSLTEKALDAGFFDQSHCINTFNSQWNLSSKSVKKMNPILFNFTRQNMLNRFSNYYDPEL